MKDEDYLRQAILLSTTSPEPIGCGAVIVRRGIVLAATHNSQRADNIAVYHAEIKAVIEANRRTGSRKLEGSTAYCSCEPCAMCLTALSYAKVKRIVFNMFMRDLFPNDPQSQLNSFTYVKTLNYVPILERLEIAD